MYIYAWVWERDRESKRDSERVCVHLGNGVCVCEAKRNSLNVNELKCECKREFMLADCVCARRK